MVEWTESERRTVTAVWDKINVDEIGPQSLARVLIVYPWTQRYFRSFGDVSYASAILNNPKVSSHGKVVLKALDWAVRNMDNIRGVYSELSRIHCEKLKVDPDNFRLLADCITIAVACKLRSEFPPKDQAIWQKFLNAVVDAMGSQYT